jgi:hypothetical protein
MLLGGFILGVVIPLDLAHLDNLATSDTFRGIQNLN